MNMQLSLKISIITKLHEWFIGTEGLMLFCLASTLCKYHFVCDFQG